MAISVTHATQSATPDSGDGKISSNAWNEGHTITGLGTAAEHDTSYFALSSHTHTIANVTGLQAALDGKQPAGSYLTTIVSADVTTALGYTPTSVTGLTGTQSVAAFKTGLSLVKGDVGLGNVDNTSDANKPVSTATQTALDGKLTVVDGGGAYAGYPKYVAETGFFVENAAGDRAFLAVDSGDLGSLYLENTDTSAWLLVGGSITANGIAVNSSHAIDFGTALLCSSVTGLGYATGAGGTQTQNTSKSQGVTLNKACGQITMNGAALAGSTSVSFTFTNSKIASTDNVLVNIASGATTNTYIVGVDQIASGSCRIHLRNISGSSRSEALVLAFTVLKGSLT